LVEYNPNLLIQPGDNNSETKIDQVLADKKNNSIGNGYSNIPEENSKLQTNVKVNIKDKNVMPDLTNYDLRDALNVLHQIGLKYKIHGEGKVVTQSILPGIKVKPGQVCYLYCEIKKNAGININ
jgi:hypothetical protein